MRVRSLLFSSMAPLVSALPFLEVEYFAVRRLAFFRAPGADVFLDQLGDLLIGFVDQLIGIWRAIEVGVAVRECG